MTQLSPYLCVADARAAIEWYVAALGAEVRPPGGWQSSSNRSVTAGS